MHTLPHTAVRVHRLALQCGALQPASLTGALLPLTGDPTCTGVCTGMHASGPKPVHSPAWVLCDVGAANWLDWSPHAGARALALITKTGASATDGMKKYMCLVSAWLGGQHCVSVSPRHTDFQVCLLSLECEILG